MSKLQENVDKLLDKAASADKSEDAVRFAQAALNAAHTHHALKDHDQPKG